MRNWNRHNTFTIRKNCSQNMLLFVGFFPIELQHSYIYFFLFIYFFSPAHFFYSFAFFSIQFFITFPFIFDGENGALYVWTNKAHKNHFTRHIYLLITSSHLCLWTILKRVKKSACVIFVNLEWAKEKKRKTEFASFCIYSVATILKMMTCINSMPSVLL